MILVAGSANLDFVVRSTHIPAPGETVLGRDFKTFPGGKGANQAVACARAGGAQTHMLLALGDDAYARPLEMSLMEAGVRMHIVRVKDQTTGIAFICVSDGAENAITVAPGANLCLNPADLPPLQGFTHLLLQLETPVETVLDFAKAARSRGVKVVLNAAPAQKLTPDMLALIDILIVNEGELTTVANFPASIANRMLSLGIPCVVVTLGRLGCCALADGLLVYQTAYEVTAIDTTGAGDTFCGTLVAALNQGNHLMRALQMASAAGALACTKLGAQSSIPTQRELAAFLNLQTGDIETGHAKLKDYCECNVETAVKP